METLGDRLRAARKEKGWNQQRLAQEVKRLAPHKKTSISSVSTIERDETKDPTIIHELSVALGVTERWLKTGLGPKERGQQANEASQVDTASDLLAAVVSSYEAFGLTEDEAQELISAIVEAADEPLSDAARKDAEQSRRILSSSATRRFFKQKNITIRRSPPPPAKRK